MDYLGQRLIKRGPEKYLGKVAAEWTVALQPAPDHWEKRMELETPLQEAGAYWVEAKFAGGHLARALLWIEGITLVESRQDDSANWFVCDAVSGAPVPGVKAHFFGYWRDWQDRRGSANSPRYRWHFREFDAVSDANGEIVFPQAAIFQPKPTYVSKGKLVKVTNDSFEWLISARDDLGREAYHGFERINLYNPSLQGANNRHYTITDRPVYRPGQEVKWKIWAREVDYAENFDTNPFKKTQVSVALWNPRNESVYEKTLITDEHGGLSDTFTLPDDATLGTWTVRAASYPVHLSASRNTRSRSSR